jgi:DNA-binding LacI/PurR family transcriptional regulator
MANKNTQVMSAIEQDIRARGLRPGQPYQSAREVAQMLDVSPMTADRAMRRLASTGVLARRHGSGTYVGDAMTERALVEINQVQIVISANFYHVYRVVVENIVATVHREFPTDSIEQIFVPESKPVPFCTQVIKRWDEGRPPRTVVLVSCSLQIQRLFGDTGVPVVATGGVAKNNCSLPWIDMDHRNAGRLLAAYARSLGHRRFLVLMNHLWGCGDNDFLDGIDEGLRSGGGTTEARVRSVEWDAAAIETVLLQALRSDAPPTGVLCTTRFTAEVAVNVAERMNKSIPEDFVVGTVLIRMPVGNQPKYAYTRWGTTRESNDALYRMVHQMNQGQKADPDHFLIPVELVEPAQTAWC